MLDRRLWAVGCGWGGSKNLDRSVAPFTLPPVRCTSKVARWLGCYSSKAESVRLSDKVILYRNSHSCATTSYQIHSASSSGLVLLAFPFRFTSNWGVTGFDSSQNKSKACRLTNTTALGRLQIHTVPFCFLLCPLPIKGWTTAFV